MGPMHVIELPAEDQHSIKFPYPTPSFILRHRFIVRNDIQLWPFELNVKEMPPGVKEIVNP